jgi:hypothetical protein
VKELLEKLERLANKEDVNIDEFVNAKNPYTEIRNQFHQLSVDEQQKYSKEILDLERTVAQIIETESINVNDFRSKTTVMPWDAFMRSKE